MFLKLSFELLQFSEVNSETSPSVLCRQSKSVAFTIKSYSSRQDFHPWAASCRLWALSLYSVLKMLKLTGWVKLCSHPSPLCSSPPSFAIPPPSYPPLPPSPWHPTPVNAHLAWCHWSNAPAKPRQHSRACSLIIFKGLPTLHLMERIKFYLTVGQTSCTLQWYLFTHLGRLSRDAASHK